MQWRACPMCRHDTLFSTGAFWRCRDCGYAITESALSVDEGRARSGAAVPAGASD